MLLDTVVDGTHTVFTHKLAIYCGNSPPKHKHAPTEPALKWIVSLSSIVLTVINCCPDISISKLSLYSSGVTLNPSSLLCRPPTPLPSPVLIAYARACCCRV